MAAPGVEEAAPLPGGDVSLSAPAAGEVEAPVAVEPAGDTPPAAVAGEEGEEVLPLVAAGEVMAVATAGEEIALLAAAGVVGAPAGGDAPTPDAGDPVLPAADEEDVLPAAGGAAGPAEAEGLAFPAAGEEEEPVGVGDELPLPSLLPSPEGEAVAPAPAAGLLAAGLLAGELTGLVAVPSAAAMYAAAAADAASGGGDLPEAACRSCQITLKDSSNW